MFNSVTTFQWDVLHDNSQFMFWAYCYEERLYHVVVVGSRSELWCKIAAPYMTIKHARCSDPLLPSIIGLYVSFLLWVASAQAAS